jgi:hypothetical protein
MRRQALGAAVLGASLLAASASPADALTDGFEGSDFSPAGGLYYKENSEQAAGTVEFQRTEKRTGEGALKLSVRPLCPAGDELCSERAEIWERPALRVPYEDGVWYGFAVKFADPIPQDDHRYLIAQWKREIDPGAEGDFSPFLALRLRNGKLFATVETNFVASQAPAPDASGACPAGAVPAWLRPSTNQMRMLVATDPSWLPADGSLFNSCTDAVTVAGRGNPLPRPDSGWIDFAVYTRPGPDGSGRIELFANGAPVVTVTGRIGHAGEGLGANQYFKFGPYRAAHSGVWTLFYDDFRRSPRCADVLKGALCPPI